MGLDVARRGQAGGASRAGGARPGPRRQVGLWRGRPTGPRAAGKLAGLRLARGWPLLLVVGAGMLVAVVLICTVPLYTSLVANVQLQRAIHSGSSSSYDVQAVAASDSIAAAGRDEANARVLALGKQYFAPFVAAQTTYYVTSDDMLLLKVGKQTFDPSDPRARQVTYNAFDFAAAAPHMRFLSGGAPQAGKTPQAIVTREMADAFHLTTGMALTVAEFGEHSLTSTVTISGVWEPVSVNDPYWNGLDFSASSGGTVIYPVLVSADTFFGELTRFSGLGMHQNWIFYTQPDSITTSNMSSVAAAVGTFRSRMNGDVQALQGITSVSTLTGLDQTVADIQAQQALLALPLYVIVAQVVGLALLFVVAMSALLVEGQAQEISTLKSRGASASQLLATFSAQGLLLGIFAAVAGPFLAALLAIWLIKRFVASSVLTGAGISSSYLTQLANPASVIVPAVVGSLLGVAAVILTARQSARMDVLAFRREQARPTRVPFWKRYYLDLALVALCLVGYFELGQFAGTSTRAALGGASSPLLLVTPALLLLAGALIVLRVLPLGAQAGARVAARGRGLTSLLAFAQVERSPGRYSRMTLLLVLAVGLGFFALTFDASLTHNVSDHAAYAVGADLRLTTADGLGKGRDTTELQQLQQQPGVGAITEANRAQLTTTPDQGNNPVDVLAIDPATFGGVAGPVSWRSDFASVPLSTLMQRVASGGKSGQLPAVVSDAFASQYHVYVGDAFTLGLPSSGVATFTTVAIAQEFPTLYPNRLTGSFIVTDLNAYLNTLRSNVAPGGDTSTLGPNEFWLRFTGSGQQETHLLKTLGQAAYHAQIVLSLRETVASGVANPVSAGMRGLLLVGAVTAALLAVLGSIIQSLLATRQRARQFAVLRTIGMAGRELTGLLLGEQVVVYLFGLVGGLLLGLLLATATLPFLQFSDTTIDPSTLGVPPYTLTFNWQAEAYFIAALLLAFGVALLIAARYANTIGLGKALRLGED
ncbi:MAG: FtsX-like permease family protein [Ktedonobacterales bacterium]